MKGNAGGVGEFQGRASVIEHLLTYVKVSTCAFFFFFVFPFSSVSVPLQRLTWRTMRDDDLVTRHEGKAGQGKD